MQVGLIKNRFFDLLCADSWAEARTSFRLAILTVYFQLFGTFHTLRDCEFYEILSKALNENKLLDSNKAYHWVFLSIAQDLLRHPKQFFIAWAQRDEGKSLFACVLYQSLALSGYCQQIETVSENELKKVILSLVENPWAYFKAQIIYRLDIVNLEKPRHKNIPYVKI